MYEWSCALRCTGKGGKYVLRNMRGYVPTAQQLEVLSHLLLPHPPPPVPPLLCIWDSQNSTELVLTLTSQKKVFTFFWSCFSAGLVHWNGNPWLGECQATQGKVWIFGLMSWERKDCDRKLSDWLELQLQSQNKKLPLHGVDAFWSSFVACVMWWDPCDKILMFNNLLLLLSPFLYCCLLFAKRSVLLLTQ